MAADRVDQGQAARRQHRDLVDHQHLRPLDAGGEPAIGGERIEIAGVERVAHADAAPGMDGHAMAMRGGDAGRGGIGVIDAVPLQPLDIAVDRVGLAAAGLAGEEDRCAGLEQSQRFVLCHAAMPSGRRPASQAEVPRVNNRTGFSLVMPGLVPGIHEFLHRIEKTGCRVQPGASRRDGQARRMTASIARA